MSRRDVEEGTGERPSFELLQRAEVLGVRVIAERLDHVLDAVADILRSRSRPAAYLCPTGVHGVMEAQKDSMFREILNGAALNLADGMPLVYASRLMGFHAAERAFGPAVMWAILQRTDGTGIRHFFYGGREGVAEALATRVQQAFPGVVVAGTYCPPFRSLTDEELERIAVLINASRADVVWVGLSTPKQERWIDRMRDRLDVKLLCSVGAAFDYHTGGLKDAPVWMKEAALEWLFRLWQEPRRLWRRYLEIVPTFLVLITLQITGLKRFPADEGRIAPRRS